MMTTTNATVVDLAGARRQRRRGLVLRTGGLAQAGSSAALATVRAFPAAAGTARAPYDPRFAAAVLAGLASPEKSVPSTWLYDRRGSALFERITQSQEYYAARNEVSVLRHCAPIVADQAGRDAIVVEIGSGASRKAPLLLSALDRPHAYVPIDIAAEFLVDSVAALRGSFPRLRTLPLIADFTRPFSLPAELASAPAGARRLMFFAGSAIGNLSPQQAVQCLSRLADLAGDDGLVLIGADSNRDERSLLPAYDDADGVGAEFNLNLLRRINRELDGTFDVAGFRHLVRYDRRHCRAEMHLLSLRRQHVEVLHRRFDFRAGETIRTKNAYKYDLATLVALARAAGLRRRAAWADSERRCIVYLFDTGNTPPAARAHRGP